MPSPNSYDLIPYRGNPRRMTHPDTAATVARLLGLNTAPVDSCRVLEIGCATGDNLRATAWSLPGSRFVGIDPSAVQIDLARSDARQFGLKNVEYLAIGVGELPLDSGSFDYIFCHGVYSWVSLAVQDQIFATCHRLLAPHGVAMISYNTYPGWHFRAIGREAMNFHVRAFAGEAPPSEKIRHARGYLHFLAGAAIEPESIYARALMQERDIVTERDDCYIFHEHLEEHNSPCYFHEFNARARGHGLQYLAEAGHNWFLTGLPEQTRLFLHKISRDIIDIEQHVDFLRNRTFRHTLLARDDVPVVRDQAPNFLAGMLARSAPESKPDTAPSALTDSITYRNIEEVTMTTASPLYNAILLELIQRWPRAVPLEELQTTVDGRFATKMPADREEAAAKFPKAVSDLSSTGFLSLHTWQPDYVVRASDCPLAWPIAQHAARSTTVLPTLTHQCVRLSALDGAVLIHCTGSNDVDTMMRILRQEIAAGKLEAPEGELSSALQTSLTRLASCALLVG